MAVCLPKDAPKFKASVKGLMSRPHASLHPEILRPVAVIVWALDFIHVPDVAVVGLNPLARLKAVGEFVQKKMTSFHLPAG
jgi:hypothetical protein